MEDTTGMNVSGQTKLNRLAKNEAMARRIRLLLKPIEIVPRFSDLPP